MQEESVKNFIQQNSPDGGFLQSDEWRKFQEGVGRKTHDISSDNFCASIVEHKLPIVGKYLYVPRGPIYNLQFTIYNQFSILNDQIKKLIELAEKNNAGWIRIEPANEEILSAIKKNINYKITKAPHDMQPKEILVMDIAKSEEAILAGMKQKTRYNIRLAEKKDVEIIEDRKYIDEFIELTKVMAKRQGIVAHPDEYYRKMLEAIPRDILKLYVAKYKNKVIAANLAIFFGNTCTYLHGASDDDYRNVMSPYLLQWKQIQDARIAGCKNYDFGGVKINSKGGKSWEGVTRFKTGFAPNTKPVEFPGCRDIIINRVNYKIYRGLQNIKHFYFRQ
jgi:peptidoglycan pentaglycine glycine transferase (the first glycine)